MWVPVQRKTIDMVLHHHRERSERDAQAAAGGVNVSPSVERVISSPRIVTKPWGQELIFAHTPEYAGKILYVTAGHRLSLQYHEQKHETVYVRRGLIRATIATNDGALEQVKLYPGDALNVRAGRIHRFEAIEDSELFEVSTPELSDVVRISDDYGR